MNPLRVGTRPEIALLLSCSRVTVDSRHAQRIKELSRNNIDWNDLLGLAERHGLLPLLFHHLNSIYPEAVPGPVLSKLQDHFNANLGHNRFFTGEMLRVLNLFENQGILAVPFKGPVLASSVYGDLSLRQFSDLDIMIPEQHVLKAKELLLSQRYLPLLKLSPVQERAYIQSEYEYNFTHERTGVRAEIHWKCFPWELPFSLTLKELGRRLKRVRIMDREVLTFSPEDLLLILCIHGYKHCWESLGLICDVGGLIHIDQEMDWDLLLEEAHRYGSERILFLGLYLAKDLLEANLPDKVCQRIEADATLEILAHKVCTPLFKENGLLGAPERFFFHLRSIKTFWDRVLYCYFLMVPPYFADFLVLKLPSALFFLYYLIRPLRLLGKHSVGRLMNSLMPAEMSETKENRV
jgi:hypothetical protein